MGNKIVRLPRLKSRRLVSKYDRVRRENAALRIDNAPEQVDSYGPVLANVSNPVYAAATDAPAPGFVLRSEMDQRDLGNPVNKLLLFRMLKLMYGEPDILGAWVDADATNENEIVIPGSRKDWGYCVRLGENFVGEVRTRDGNTLVVHRLWGSENAIAPSKDEQQQLLKTFIDDVYEDVSNNSHLFRESELKDDAKATRIVTSNVFALNYQAALRLAQLTTNIETDDDVIAAAFEQDVTLVEDDHLMSMLPRGFGWYAAWLMFFISLESFVNTIIDVLQKKELPDYFFERLLRTAGLELNLLSLHIYCEGFEKQAVDPKSEDWKRFTQFQTARNKAFHGKLSKEHDGYLVNEDGMLFIYDPEFTSADAGEFLTLSKITAASVVEAKDTVDGIVDAVLAAMDDGTRRWVQSWLRSPMIPRVRPGPRYE